MKRCIPSGVLKSSGGATGASDGPAVRVTNTEATGHPAPLSLLVTMSRVAGTAGGSHGPLPSRSAHLTTAPEPQNHAPQSRPEVSSRHGGGEQHTLGPKDLSSSTAACFETISHRPPCLAPPSRPAGRPSQGSPVTFGVHWIRPDEKGVGRTEGAHGQPASLRLHLLTLQQLQDQPTHYPKGQADSASGAGRFLRVPCSNRHGPNIMSRSPAQLPTAKEQRQLAGLLPLCLGRAAASRVSSAPFSVRGVSVTPPKASH